MGGNWHEAGIAKGLGYDGVLGLRAVLPMWVTRQGNKHEQGRI